MSAKVQWAVHISGTFSRDQNRKGRTDLKFRYLVDTNHFLLMLGGWMPKAYHIAIEISTVQKWQLFVFHFFCPSARLGYGVFSPDYLRWDPVQLQRQVLGKVPEGIKCSGADTEVRMVRFRKVLVQSLGRLSEGSGAVKNMKKTQNGQTLRDST